MGAIMKRLGGKIGLNPILFCFLLAVILFSGSCGRLPLKLTICEVQGTGLESPYLDQEVITSGIVIADLEGVEPGGFFLVDETCPLVGEASRGLYISFEEGGDLVDQGDEIQIRGTVREYAGETRLVAGLAGLNIISLGNPLPTPIDLVDHLIPPIAFGYEGWEGQLVSLSRAAIMNREDNPGQLKAVPVIPKDPFLQLVCFQEDSFSLILYGDFLDFSLGSLEPGSELENLVGLIRQDKGGYYLHLIEKPKLRIVEPNPEAGNIYPLSSSSLIGITPTLTDTPAITLTITPSKTPQPSQTLTARPTIIPTPTIYPINLLITEIMPNPFGEEPAGEWIEIYNPVAGKLALDGIKIGDEVSPSGKEGMLRFPDGYFINGKGVMVIANQARDFISTYGFLPDFELVNSDPRVPDLIPYTGWGRNTVKLSNAGDEVLLVDPWDHVVDLIVYGASGIGAFSPPVAEPREGNSLERYPPERDEDQAGDWWEKDDPSPGRLDRSSPTPEFTPTDTPSLSPTSSLTSSPTIASPTTTLPSSSPTSTSTPTGTILRTATPVPSLTPSMIPGPTSTETLVSLLSETPGRTNSPTPPVSISPTLGDPITSTPTPESITMTPSGTNLPSPVPTETSTLWLTSTSGFTPSTTPDPVIIINEIHADPDPILGDSNRDGEVSSDDDEFLEFVNVSGEVLDISGWQVFDEIRHRYTFPDETLLSPGCGLVLFGGGEPWGDFGGSQVFTAGSLGLNNTGDLVILLGKDGVVRGTVRYGSEGNHDQSLTRNPDLYGPLPLVLHSQVPGAGSALFSPGTRIDRTVFGSCP